MYYDFQLLPNHARSWVFQSDRALTNLETQHLTTVLSAFCADWTAHNNKLLASFEVKDEYFVAVAIDESLAAASGCSLDKLVQLMQAQGQVLGINFFDRLKTVCLSASGHPIIRTVADFQKAIAKGEVLPTYLVYDNLVSNLGQYRDQHLKPIYQTWLAKYFGQDVLAEI